MGRRADGLRVSDIQFRNWKVTMAFPETSSTMTTSSALVRNTTNVTQNNNSADRNT